MVGTYGNSDYQADGEADICVMAGGGIVGGRGETAIFAVQVTENYVGCFMDQNFERALPDYLGATTVSECHEYAKKKKAAYFGLQIWKEMATKVNFAGAGECRYGNDTFAIYGEATGCDVVEGVILGTGWRNAVYKTI